MKIKQLLVELQNKTMKEVSTSLGINPSTIQRRLKKLGYEYDLASKSWHWEQTGDAPDDRNILEGIESVKKPKPETKSDKKSKEESVTYTTGHTVALTGSEIDVLREIIEGWEKAPYSNDSDQPLHERIKSIPRGSMKRKTITMTESASNRLDQFASDNRMDKQDIVYLAIIDFLEKYE